MGLGTEIVTEPAATALRNHGFVIGSGSKRNAVARVEVIRVVPTNTKVADRWQLRMMLAGRDTSADNSLSVPMEGLGEVDATDAVPTREQLELAAGAAASELESERRLMLRPAADIEMALNHDSRRIRDFAIRVAGARRLKQLVPALNKRLQDEPEGDLVLRVVGSLVQIGDTAAVGPLVELTKKRHPIFVNQIVYAVAAIGGGEAEAYLDTVAQGHPSEHVRTAAKEALAELLAKKRSARQQN
jgi:HEAT repeat protein